jgi:hypothetical protein
MPNDVTQNADNVTSAQMPRAAERGTAVRVHLRFAEHGFASRNIMAVNAA